MNALHLIWIIPLCLCAGGLFALALESDLTEDDDDEGTGDK